MSAWINANGETQTSTSNLASQEAASKGPRYEVGGTGAEVTYRDGEATLTTNSNNEHQTYASPQASVGVLDSARTEGGGMIVGRPVQATDQVIIDGMPTSAAVAAQLGFLTKNPDGSFTETAMGAESMGQGMDPKGVDKIALADGGDVETAQEEAFSLGEAGEQAATRAFREIPQGAAIGAIDEVLQTGDLSEDRINRLAAQSGHDPATVKEIVGEAWSAFYDATANRMADLGVTDGEAFMAFLNADSRRMNDMQTAARALVSENSTTGIDNIAAKFMEQADVYIADEVAGALEDAGVGYSRRADGRFLVKLDGTDVPFNVAVRQGLIKLS